MRSLLLVILLFSSFYTSAQDNSNVITNNEAIKTGMYAMNTAYVSSMWVANPSRDIEGSKFLFKNWSNKAVFHTTDKKALALKSVNIDLSSNIFVARFGKNMDSIFSFESNKIEKVAIGKSKFKFVSINYENKIVEELFESKGYGIYKHTFLRIVEGSVNPMLSRDSDEYVQKSKLYFDRNGELTEFKLKKKTILNVVAKSDKERESIIKFYKENKLSFKKIESLKKYLLTL